MGDRKTSSRSIILRPRKGAQPEGNTMRFKLHEKSANWDTVHNRLIAEFDRLDQAKICAQALADFYAVSFSAYVIEDVETGKETKIVRERKTA